MSDEIGPVVVFFSFILFLSFFCSYSCGENGIGEKYFLIHNVLYNKDATCPSTEPLPPPRGVVAWSGVVCSDRL